MSIQLNHTIAYVRDNHESAQFLTDILGLTPSVSFGPFRVVAVANGVSIDFMTTDQPVDGQHYAFLVSETEFDQIFARIQARGITYWADPSKNGKGKINRRDNGRGVYFEDPSAVFLEILTRPYGSGNS